MDCRPPGSSVCGILKGRTLEWVAMSSSRGSSQLRDQKGLGIILDLGCALNPMIDVLTRETQGKVEVEIGVTCLQNKAAKDGQSEKLRERWGVDSPLEELGGLQSMRHKDSDTTEHTRTHKHKILPQSLQEDKLTPPDFRLTATKSERNKFLLSQQPQVGGLKKLMPSCASKSSFFYTENVRMWSF